LLRNNRVVSTRTVTGNHTFRFETSPGRYVLESNQSATPRVQVTINPGTTATVNLYSACS
jgi:hypothetical protein